MDYDIQRKKCDDLERMCHNAKEIYNKLCTELKESYINLQGVCDHIWIKERIDEGCQFKSYYFCDKCGKSQ